MPSWLKAVLAVLVVLVLAAGGFAWWRQSLPLPTATLSGADFPLGRRPRILTLHLAAQAGKLKSVEVKLSQGGAEKLTRSADLSAQGVSRLDWPLEINAPEAGLAEGPVDVRVDVKDDQWRPKPDPSPRLVTTFDVDVTPPGLEVLAATGHIAPAGTGVVVYRAKGAAKSGVRVGDREFPGTKGLSTDPDVRVALYTIPYDEPPSQPVAFAEDAAGNARTAEATVIIHPKEFARDRFELKTDFMKGKVLELTPSEDVSSDAAVLASYLKINRDMRAENEKHIREIASGASEAQPLFRGAFKQQPNSQVFAFFPQQRDSLVAGQIVDTQWHLGLDLASVAGTPILAANAGKVIFADQNGIYGNMVVLDHGLGLCSLYAHLSSITVTLGQSVSQGEQVGISGKTGLAGGDHLHYAMLVHGTYTNPLDWFDEGYMHDRIALPLVTAGLQVPGLTELEAPNRPTPREVKKAVKKAARAEGKRRHR